MFGGVKAFTKFGYSVFNQPKLHKDETFKP